jgi:hypothetical protein
MVLGLALWFSLGCGTTADQRAPAGGIPVYDQVPNAPDPDTKHAVIARGIAFLLARQNADGSWGSPVNAEFLPKVTLAYGSTASFDAWRDATTGLCLSALIPHLADRPDVAATIDRAAAYLFAQEAALRATPGLYYSVWSQSYVLEAACATLATPALAHLHAAARRAGQAQIDQFGYIQGGEGGFGYIDAQESAQPSGLGSSSFVTATVLHALHQAAQQGFIVPPALVRAGRRSIELQRTAAGNYVYSRSHINHPNNSINQTPGSIGRNPLCNLALYEDDPAGIPILRKNLDEFFHFHHFLEMALGRPGGDPPFSPGGFTFHESWHKIASYFFYYGHHYAAEAARRLPAQERRRYLDGQAHIICRLQNPDGSWWDFPTIYGYHPYYGTAFALLVLRP